MKYQIHTGEWLAHVRKRARLGRDQLSRLTGVHLMTISNIEKDAHVTKGHTWGKLDPVLRERVPAAYVDMDALLRTVRSYEGVAHREGDTCRLYYAEGHDGIAFTDVRSMRDEALSAPYITVSWADAALLLETQKAIFERDE